MAVITDGIKNCTVGRGFKSACHSRRMQCRKVLIARSEKFLTKGFAPRSFSRDIYRQGTYRSDSGLAAVEQESFGHIDKLAWLRKDLNVVLVNPVIPQNTGTIARTCAATGIGLHLVGPLGFEIDDKKLKRAGLDYWEYVAVRQYDSWQEFYEIFAKLAEPKRLVGFTKFATTHFATEGQYQPGDWLLFGSETSGLPQEVHDLLPSAQMVKIPMRQKHVRSLNLSVSVGIGVFEAIRQLDGPNFTADQ